MTKSNIMVKMKNKNKRSISNLVIVPNFSFQGWIQDFQKEGVVNCSRRVSVSTEDNSTVKIYYFYRGVATLITSPPNLPLASNAWHNKNVNKLVKIS